MKVLSTLRCSIWPNREFDGRQLLILICIGWGIGYQFLPLLGESSVFGVDPHLISQLHGLLLLILGIGLIFTCRNRSSWVSRIVCLATVALFVDLAVIIFTVRWIGSYTNLVMAWVAFREALYME